MKQNNLSKMVFIVILLLMSFVGSSESVYSACITVTSPNGAEVLIPGSSKTITWTYDNSGQPGYLVKIELLKGGILNTVINAFAQIGSNGNGSYNWTIPAQQAGGNDYSIRVTSITKPTCTDMSDSNFNIYSLKITSPNGGENWIYGSSNKIKWDATGWPQGEKIRVELWQGANLTGTIRDNLDDFGWIEWFVGSTGPVNQYTWVPPGSGYKIKIVSHTTNLSDMSDGVFTIVPPAIHLTSPNGGEIWTFGTTKQITWTSSGILTTELVKIVLLKGGNQIATLAPGYYSNNPQNSLNWTVGNADVPYETVGVGNNYKVKITTSISNISDESDGVFTIAPATIRITAPNGGENWSMLYTKQITWTSEGCSDVSKIYMQLLQGTSFKCDIVKDILTKQGSYSWPTGKCADGSMVSTASDYKIRFLDEGGCSSFSGTVTSDGTFRISYPNIPPNISGQWKSSIGLVYSIKQEGSQFKWTVANSDEKGKGTITGYDISASWQGQHGTGSSAGKITAIDASGTATEIKWNNGVRFYR
jgi:hypothetical protein